MTAFETTFDSAARDYDRSRPEYVREIYKDIFRFQPLGPESRALEIGLGTGKASRPILDTGCQLVGLEPGVNLAALARERFRGYKNFCLLNQTLQAYDGADGAFDLVFAATAFHWLPEAYGYKRVFDLLKPGGAFARFAYHAGPDRGRSALAEEIQALYRRYMCEESYPAEFGRQDAQRLAEKAALYGFTDLHSALYHAAKDFTAGEYMALLRTYPDHLRLDPADRQGLFDGIRAAIERHGGTLTVHYAMDLELARRPLA